MCGSSRFKDWFRLIERRLGLEGNLVLAPNVYAKSENLILTDKQKEILDKIHLKRIEISNEIYVINTNGYIGETTSKEIEYAKMLKLKIRYLENREEK